MLRTAMVGAALVASLLFTGCASIVSGTNQPLSVVTRNQGTDFNGAKCSLENDKGTWYVTTPGSVTVRRSYNDLLVTCGATGADTGILSVKSKTKGMAFGNILFGGVVGVGVDAATGAAYDYPEVITVNMGEIVRPEPAKPAGKDDTPPPGTPVPATAPATPEAPATPPPPPAASPGIQAVGPG